MYDCDFYLYISSPVSKNQLKSANDFAQSIINTEYIEIMTEEETELSKPIVNRSGFGKLLDLNKKNKAITVVVMDISVLSEDDCFYLRSIAKDLPFSEIVLISSGAFIYILGLNSFMISRFIFNTRLEEEFTHKKRFFSKSMFLCFPISANSKRLPKTVITEYVGAITIVEKKYQMYTEPEKDITRYTLHEEEFEECLEEMRMSTANIIVFFEEAFSRSWFDDFYIKFEKHVKTADAFRED